MAECCRISTSWLLSSELLVIAAVRYVRSFVAEPRVDGLYRFILRLSCRTAFPPHTARLSTMAPGSGSSFIHFPNMLEALKADYQVISKTFASVTLILRKIATKASSSQGWAHTLVEKWLNLWAVRFSISQLPCRALNLYDGRQYFKKLHQRAQRDSNRLATCLRCMTCCLGFRVDSCTEGHRFCQYITPTSSSWQQTICHRKKRKNGW